MEKTVHISKSNDNKEDVINKKGNTDKNCENKIEKDRNEITEEFKEKFNEEVKLHSVTLNKKSTDMFMNKYKK